MDELIFLCTQELLKDMMNDVSSSDEDEEAANQNMEALTHLCAQNLMDNLMDTSSSSSAEDEEDDEFLLGCINLMEKSEMPSKQNGRINQQQKPEERRHMHKDKPITALQTKNRAKATLLDQHRPNLSAELKLKGNRHDNYAFKETEIVKVFAKAAESVTKRSTDKDTISSSCNLQFPLDEGIIDSLSENEFKRYFHIDWNSLNYLMERFSTWYLKGSGQRPPNHQKTNILIFLWFCANPVSFESVTRIFNASLEETKEYFNIILEFFETGLASEVIKLPTLYTEKEAIAKDFEKIDGFPNVLGCFAVSGLSLKTPELLQICNGPQLHLRGICDSNCKFLDIKIVSTKTSENDIFSEKVLSKLCFPKYHLLGDPTCPIRDHLIIPYEYSANLSKSEEYFNTKYYRTHVKIKVAFTNLTNRFRQLQYLDFNNIETLSKFIKACCILHNICLDRQDFYDETTSTDASCCWQSAVVSSVSKHTDDFLNDLGLKKRYELTQVLFRKKK